MTEVSLDSLYARRNVDLPQILDRDTSVSRQAARAEILKRITEKFSKQTLHLGLRSHLEIQVLKLCHISRDIPEDTLESFGKLLSLEPINKNSISEKTNLFCLALKAGAPASEMDCIVSLIDKSLSKNYLSGSKLLENRVLQLSDLLLQAQELGLAQHINRSLVLLIENSSTDIGALLFNAVANFNKARLSSLSDEAKAFGLCCGILGWNFETISEYFEAMRESPPLSPFIDDYLELASTEIKTSLPNSTKDQENSIPLALKCAYIMTTEAEDLRALSLIRSATRSNTERTELISTIIQIRSKSHETKLDLEKQFYDTVESFKDQEINIAFIRSAFFAVDNPIKFHSLKRKLALAAKHKISPELLPNLSEDKLPISSLISLNELYLESEKNKRSEAANIIKDIIKKIAGSKESQELVTDLVDQRTSGSAIAKLSSINARLSTTRSPEMEEEELLLKLVRAQTTSDQETFAAEFASLITGDSTPYRLGGVAHRQHHTDPSLYPDHPKLAQKMVNETYEVMARAFDHAYGFNSLTFDSRAIGSDTGWSLARFGLDCGIDLFQLNSSDVSKFPGKGLAIRGLKPELIFPSDPLALIEDQDPFEEMKKALPWAATELEKLSQTSFILTRGFIAVIPPDDEIYKIKGIHYSYVVLNQHFHQALGRRAFLIPTDVLTEKIDPTLKKYMDSAGFDPNMPDLTKLIDSAVSLATYKDENIINIGWGSNVGGGLCNAFRPGSSMFHSWEKDLKYETKDKYGHVHKSHIMPEVPFYLMTPKKDEKLEPLREAHKLVYEACSSLQNLFDLFRFAFAQYHKGLTSKTRLEDFEESEERELLLNKADQAMQDSSLDQPLLGHFRLKEAYKFHKTSGPEGKNIASLCPILCITDVTDYSGLPDSPILLDTMAMQLTNNSGQILQLPLDDDGSDSLSTAIWSKYVVPHLDFDKDLRFLDRSLFEN